MASNRFSIKVDTKDVAALAERLGEVDRDALGTAVVVAINDAADNADDLAKKTILSGINLTEGYVERKLKRTPATTQKPTAEIRAPSSREYLTNLSHYDPQQLLIPVTWSNERIVSAGHKFGQKGPGGFPWTKRKGRPGLGIPVNSKGDGKQVQVVRGQRKRVATAFAIKGKTDNEGNLLIFKRNKFTDKIQALTGPSVYQLFRIAATKIEDQVGEDLAQQVVLQAEKVLKKVFE